MLPVLQPGVLWQMGQHCSVTYGNQVHPLLTFTHLCALLPSWGVSADFPSVGLTTYTCRFLRLALGGRWSCPCTAPSEFLHLESEPPATLGMEMVPALHIVTTVAHTVHGQLGATLVLSEEGGPKYIELTPQYLGNETPDHTLTLSALPCPPIPTLGACGRRQILNTNGIIILFSY